MNPHDELDRQWLIKAVEALRCYLSPLSYLHSSVCYLSLAELA